MSAFEEFGLSAPCPICVHSITTSFYQKNGREMLICEHCRHVFWAAMPTDEQLAIYYRTEYGARHDQEQIQEANTLYYEAHLDELLKFFGKPAEETSLVDFGSSYPRLLFIAKRRGFFAVAGVDFDECAIRDGREHGISMYTPDSFAAEVADQSVDVVRFSHTLEHLRDPVATLRAAVGKLKAGGIAYITQPSFPVLAFGVSRHELKDAVWPEHLHFFSPISLWQMARTVGLSVEKFFTHQNASEMAARYADELDIDLAIDALKPLAAMGDAFFGDQANYPIYTGENSVLFGRRVQVPAMCQPMTPAFAGGSVRSPLNESTCGNLCLVDRH
jgi:SAM-dependent methyltransferase